VLVTGGAGYLGSELCRQAVLHGDEVLAALRASGVGADVYYPLPAHRQPYLAEYVPAVDLPATDAAAAETLALLADFLA